MASNTGGLGLSLEQAAIAHRNGTLEVPILVGLRQQPPNAMTSRSVALASEPGCPMARSLPRLVLTERSRFGSSRHQIGMPPTPAIKPSFHVNSYSKAIKLTAGASPSRH
jgi:hypothetical protein